MANQEKSTCLRRTFKYRCYPGVTVQANANRIMREVNKAIWNEALWHRERNRRDVGSVLSVNAGLTKDRRVPVPQLIDKHGLYELISTNLHPEYAGTNAQSREQVLDKLYASYEAFRALRKNGHKDARPPGKMKFCGWVIYRQSGWRLDGHILYLAGIGSIPIRLHRPIGGKIKTVTLRVKNGKWYVCFSCEIEDFPGACHPVSEAKTRKGKALDQECPSSGGRVLELKGTDNHTVLFAANTIWLDVDGVFLVDSTGRTVPVPGFYEKALPLERRLSRTLSRKKRRSSDPNSPERGCNRLKALRTLQKFREHIANQRSAFLWSEAKRYATLYRRILLIRRPAKIPIQYAKDERTARGLCDGAYALFEDRLKQKCEEYGTEFLGKDRATWEQEKRQYQEQGKMERLQPILRAAKRKQKRRARGLPASTQSLVRACEKLTTWQIT